MALASFLDWNINEDITVLSVFQTTPTETGYSVVSIDTDGDGIPGTAMNNDPYLGQTAVFSGDFYIAPLPVPASIWLLGSDILGIIGLVRIKIL